MLLLTPAPTPWIWNLKNVEPGKPGHRTARPGKTQPLNADAKFAGCRKKIRRPHSMIFLKLEICLDETLSKSFQKVIIEAF